MAEREPAAVGEKVDTGELYGCSVVGENVDCASTNPFAFIWIVLTFVPTVKEALKSMI